MWVATVDFMKAFDSTSHQSSWKALEKMRYRIKSQQLLEETVRGTERDSLNGQRKRNTVLQMALKDDVERW